MMAMAEHIVGPRASEHGNSAPVHFIHGARTAGACLRRESLKVAAGIRKCGACLLQPAGAKRLARHDDDDEGHVTLDVLRKVLPFGDYDFYLCGPPPFMQALMMG